MYREINLIATRITAAENELEIYNEALDKKPGKAEKAILTEQIEATKEKIKQLEASEPVFLKLLANGATPYLYKNAFKQDMLLGMRRNQAKTQSENAEEAENASFNLIDIGTKAAYIMNRQAENASLSKLSESDFFEWLKQFAPMTFLEDALQGEIYDLILEDQEASSTSKNS